MKIELWAKKLNGGHVKIGTQEVPENFGYEYRLPIKNPINVVVTSESTTPSQPMSSYRTFRFMPSPDNRAFKTNKRYLEV